MKMHKIRVKVEIVECEAMQDLSGELEQLGDGEFELLISPDQAASIDDCEASLLRANYLKTVRNSVEHFSFFLLPFSFFFEREKKILARQEGRRKKEEGRRNTLILLMFHYAHSSIIWRCALRWRSI
jgi:hypothetical protein